MGIALQLFKYVCYVLIVLGAAWYGLATEFVKIVPPEILQRISTEQQLQAEQQARYERSHNVNDLPTCFTGGLSDLQKFASEHQDLVWKYGLLYGAGAAALLYSLELGLRKLNSSKS
jgi:hypothetical protein